MLNRYDMPPNLGLGEEIVMYNLYVIFVGKFRNNAKISAKEGYIISDIFFEYK